MANFKAGDVVVLTVGTSVSPRMTIVWVEDDEAVCTWYSRLTETFNQQKFPVECLIPA